MAEVSVARESSVKGLSESGQRVQNMMKHAKKATTQQGAQKTIFMLNGRFGKYRGAIRKLQTKGYHGYYIRGEKVFEY